MNQNKSVEELLLYGKQYLKQCNIETSIDAQVILMYVLNFSKIDLFLKNKVIVTTDEQNKYIELLKKRGKGVPTQYIVGKQEFMSLDFLVNEETLIPRADTEILVETILNVDKNIKYILDIGTGTGCIPISLLHYSKDMKALAIDINLRALELAEHNACINNVEDRITFIQSDLFSNLPDKFINKFDAIVSNPPYIPTEDIESLMKEVKDYEPYIALNGGIDGLDFYRKITIQSQKYLKSGGFIFYEIGYNQAKDVSCILENSGFTNIHIIKDLSGLDRVIMANK